MAILGGGMLVASAATVTATYNAATDVPVTAAGYTATGNTVNFTLNFAPAVGAELTVVRNTSPAFIAGVFDNLAQGQIVALGFSGTTYYFVANYYGGSGNDLVLTWAHARAFAWGLNATGQVGDASTTQRNAPVAVGVSGILSGKTILTVANGQGHSLALCSDGTLAAWGQNDHGQLGDGTTTQRTSPVAVTIAGTPLAGKLVVAVAAGMSHSLALCSDGTVATWGYNSSGQLGDESLVDRLVPVAVTTSSGALVGRTVTAIGGGSLFSVALCSDGRVAAWGYNANGQLGDTTGTLSGVPVLAAQNGILSGRIVVAIAVGVNHVLALCSDNAIAAWGYNFGGQIGDGSSGSGATRYSAVQVTAAGTPLAGKAVQAIAAGEHHSLALCVDGTLVAWGLNASGQVGDNTVTLRANAVAVTTAGTALAGKTVVAIGAGLSHSFAVCSDGTLVGWGKNASGQVGDNSTTQRNAAVAVNTSGLAGGDRFVRVTSGVGAEHSIAVVARAAAAPPGVATMAATSPNAGGAVMNGTVCAFGTSTAVSFDYGLTTAYGTNTAGTPTPVTGGVVTPVSATLTGLTPNTAYHYRVKGVSGAGTTTGADLVFATLSNNANLAGLALSAGALSPGFSAGTTSYSATVNTAYLTLAPTAADAGALLQLRLNGGSFATVASGTASAVQILPVGANVVELKVTASDGSTVQTYTVNVTRAPPTPVNYTYNTATGVPVTASAYEATDNTATLALGFAPAPGTELMVVKNTGLGFITGAFSNLAQGQAVALSFGGTTYNFVANYYGGTGNDLVLVWAATRLFGWGENASGQLGDNTTTRRLLPVRARGALAGKTILSAGAGTNHTLAWCSDGSLVVWGRNVEGQLGDGSGLQRNIPTILPTAGTPLAGKTVVAIAVGSSHNLVLCSDGTLVSWGANDFGELGDNSIINRNVPVAVVTAGTPLAGKTVVAIAAGVYHSMALCSDGTVATWGWNQQGQIGDNTNTQRNKPTALITAGTPLAGKTVTAIAGGWGQSLALCSDGTLAAWGMIGFGIYSNLPAAFSGTGVLASKTAAAIAAGYNHSLVLCTDGTVAAWGYNGLGELGDGTTAFSRDVPTAVDISGVLAGKTVRSIAAGFEVSLALCTDGTMAAWGTNANGQLGDNTLVQQRYSPVAVNASPLAVSETAARLYSGPYALHSLGVMTGPPLPEIAIYDGVGANAGAERLNNTGIFSFPLVPVVGNSGLPQAFTIQNIGTGDLTSVAVAATLGGNAGDFSVNSGGLATTLVPGATATFTVTFSPSAAGTRTAGLAIASNDPAKNPFGVALLGNETLTAHYSAATNVPVTSGAYTAAGKLVDLALNYAPAVGTQLTVVGNTGANAIGGAFGNLAQGQPVTLNFNGHAYDFVANYRGGAGRDLVLVWAATRAVAWGDNSFGQLGDNTTTSRPSAASVTNSGVLAGKTIVALAGGSSHSLPLCSDGTLAAWGKNDTGQLGDSTTTQRLVPVAVTTAGTPLAGKTVIAIAVGDGHSMALCSDGTLAAWGFNSGGQVGDNTVTQRSAPVAVTITGTPLAGKTIMAIAAGRHHSLALCSDGTMAAWGLNFYGELGDNSTTDRHVPVAVVTAGTPLAGKAVASIAAGAYHSLALATDGTLVAWGRNLEVQLGEGTGTQRNAPFAVTTAGTALAGKTVVAVAGGTSHSLALCSDGTLASWGLNTNGQLGDNSTTLRTVPVAVNAANGVSALFGRTVVAIAAGASHSQAICADGTLVAWGKNSPGQLGDGTTTQRLVPVVAGASALAAGERFVRSAAGSFADHSLAWIASGTPEISVFEGNGLGGAERQTGSGTFAFANGVVGNSGSPQTFTVQNTGGAMLTGLVLSGTGAQAGDFVLGSLGATSLAPGATTTFTVTFAPAAAGARSAAVQIASNDADENPFVINLSSLALTPQDLWRQTNFGSTANSGNAANSADPDGDGLVNLVEYALGLDPLAASTAGLPQVSTTGSDWVYTYTRPAATTEVTYQVEVSTNLATWTTAGVTHEIVSSSGGIETWHALFPLSSAPNVFFRLKVSVP